MRSRSTSRSSLERPRSCRRRRRPRSTDHAAVATSVTRALVGDDGALVVLPDPTVCFAGASFAQEQHVALASAASLVLVDWITAGRRASGERWAFDRFTSRLTVQRAAAPDPRGRGLALGRRGLPARAPGAVRLPVHDRRHRAFAPMPCAGGDRGGRADARPARGGSAVLGRGLGDDGCVVRLAGTSVEDVGRAMRAHLQFVPALLGDNPWARKW